MKNNLENIIDDLKSNLSEGLLACDIWSKETGLSLVAYNQNFKYTAVLNKTMKELEKNLLSLGIPAFNNYQITELEMQTLLIILKLDDTHYIGFLLDKTKVAFGTLLHIIIPNIIDTYNDLD